MTMVAGAKPIWTPGPQRVGLSTIKDFARHVGHSGPYEELWEWSVRDLEGFWKAVWDFFDIQADGNPTTVLGSRTMPGATWFPDVELNYAEHVFRGRCEDEVAVRHCSEMRPLEEWSWRRLRAETIRIREGLNALGVSRGDRVASYLPNIPETIAAFLATASLGAVWSSAAPEFGARLVCDRFAQIQPKVLLAVDGYRYGGRDFDCRPKVAHIVDEIGVHAVRFGHLDGSGWEAGFDDHELVDTLTFERVPFDHPLWILYTSGTTGPPKPIVHGHGGILLEQLKHQHLHLDARPDDRVLWFTTTGWMMWNFLVGVLLTRASIVLYDGSPARDVLWDVAAESGTTIFGTSAAYLSACIKDGVRPADGRDLSAVHAVGSTGSPLSSEAYDWVYEQFREDTWLFSTSGGTDVCTAFVTGVPTLPVYGGELQARALGAAVQAFDESGNALIDATGELVLTQPLPSMPISFWGDDDGSRYRQTYFDTYPGIWRHGDWIEITHRGSAIISGRSDATINRGGVRMGTSEIYRAVLALHELTDALVVDIEGWMPLFVVLRGSAELDDALIARIVARIRTDCSPRHIPDEIHRIGEVPRTHSGKAVELPVKRILMGEDPNTAVDPRALANPQALEPFRALGRDRIL